VLIAMILHATNNAVGGAYASQLLHGTWYCAGSRR